ncbi:hypothetical protein [Bradyrhizobium sp. OAE829]|uniref:hypothetical protein n=1 Tax=Bradyrhizobium sp. OAE829 TaxID=2663807 RepID=UPI00178BDF13
MSKLAFREIEPDAAEAIVEVVALGQGCFQQFAAKEFVHEQRGNVALPCCGIVLSPLLSSLPRPRTTKRGNYLIGFEIHFAASSRNRCDLSIMPSRRFRKCGKTTRRANLFGFAEIMSSPEIKNISVYRKTNQGHIYRHPALLRRASAVVTDVGRVAVDAGLRLTTAWTGVRQNRVVLAPVAGVKLSEKRKRKR